MDNRHLPWRRVVREKGVICRACAKYRECSSNIFISTDAFNIPVFGLLRDLLNVEVKEGDGLPDTICRKCVNKLVEFYEFKLMYVNSETELRKRSEFKWLLEEEVRPWEEFTEEENLVEDGFQGVSAANLQRQANEIGVVHLVKEEEVERNAVTAEAMKIETDSAEHLDSGQTSTSNMDPFRIDVKVEDNMEIDDCSPNSEVRREENEGSEEECGGGGDAPIPETEQENQVDLKHDGSSLIIDDVCLDEDLAGNRRQSEADIGFDCKAGGTSGQVDSCNNIGKLTLEPENESDKFVADRQWISQKEVLNDPSCDPVREENLQLEHSMANSFVVNCLPEERVKNRKKNVKFYASSKKQFSQLNDKAKPIRNQEHEQLCNQAENANYPTEYICYYCSTRYLEKKSLAVHIKRHVDGMRSKRLLPKKDIPPRYSENLLGNAFRCNECGKKFSTKRDISSHLLVHSGVKPFKGNECGKMFNKRSSLNAHSVIHTGVKRFKCNECSKMFTQKGNLKMHSFVHTGVKRFKCNECGKMFTTKSDLKRHSLVHTGVKGFKCNECGKMFTLKYNLKMHSLIHTGVKKFKCNECGKMFTQRSSLNTHSVIHTGVKGFKCNECGKMFTLKYNLKMHSLIHTGVKKFKCNECGKMFTQRSSLNTHSVIHTGVKRFKCNECGKMFTQKYNLKMHSLIHTGVKKFKCNECGKMFTQKCNLKMHSLIHTGVKKFKCNECGKMFTQKCNLKIHLLIHTGVKKFKCNECGKMFTARRNLKCHLLVHSGVKKFKCNECGKMFTTSNKLKCHSLVHSGVKPFKCDECGKSFTIKGNLKNHSVVHTGVKRFKCNECGKMFTRSSSLRSHSVVHTSVS